MERLSNMKNICYEEDYYEGLYYEGLHYGETIHYEED